VRFRSSLGAVVIGAAGVRYLLVHGGDVDDLAALASPRLAQLDVAAAAEERSVQVGLDRLVEDLGRELSHFGARGVHTRVVHEDVDRAEGLGSLVEEPFDLLLVADVGLHDDRPTIRRLHGLTRLFGPVAVLQIVDHDVGALLGELDRGSPPDSGIRAGDQRHLVL